MQFTEEQQRKGEQAKTLAQKLVELVAQGETPGVRVAVLSAALGAVIGTDAPCPEALAEVLDIAGMTAAQNAGEAFSRRLRAGEVQVDIEALLHRAGGTPQGPTRH